MLPQFFVIVNSPLVLTCYLIQPPCTATKNFSLRLHAYKAPLLSIPFYCEKHVVFYRKRVFCVTWLPHTKTECLQGVLIRIITQAHCQGLWADYIVNIVQQCLRSVQFVKWLTTYICEFSIEFCVPVVIGHSFVEYCLHANDVC